ncbi:MAG TPA: VOC family protein [Candidatus Eisenbacteria bacterium]|nr:VOC family protein [Candidatus Eisenbacteria bacterium]
MTQLTPYLSFDGNCAEAMEFYKSCLGGELEINKVGDSPMKDKMPDKKDWVMHSMLKSDGIVLMASDLMMGGELHNGDNITLTINGGSLEQLKDFFDKLAVGGKVRQPLQPAFFGTYGDLVDKFGVLWAFQSDEK